MIFEPNKADLTGLLNTKQSLYVSTAMQKAFIEVNEEGTEAGVVTGKTSNHQSDHRY